jgi:hypothetical protein
MLALHPRLSPNELHAGGVNRLHPPSSGKASADLESCAVKHCAGRVAACLVCGDVERGTVFDGAAPQPLRMLLSNSSVLESADGQHWTLAGQWRPSYMDPMIGAVRTHDGGLRARSHCRFVPPLIHFIPNLLTYSVLRFLKRQCD